MLNSKQLSEMLNLSQSAVRRYIKVYGKYFSTGATKKRYRVYNERDISVARQIQMWYELGLTEDKIKEKLAEYVDTSEPEQHQETALAVIIPRFDEQIQHTRKDVTELQDWRENWVNEWNAFNRKNALTRLWLRITGRAPAKPPGI